MNKSKAEKLRMWKDVVAQGGMVSMIIGLVIVSIVAIAVGIPVINDTIESAALTGTTKTIVATIPVLMAVVPLVAIAALLTSR